MLRRIIKILYSNLWHFGRQADPQNEMIWISVYIDTGSAKHLAYWENGNCTFLLSRLGMRSWMSTTSHCTIIKLIIPELFLLFLVQSSPCVASV